MSIKVIQTESRCREHFFDTITVGEEEIPMDRHCDLPLHHTGPHSALASRRATAERKKWEEDNPDLVDKRSGIDIVV